MAKLEPKQRTEMVEDKEKKAQVCRFCSSGADLRGGPFFKRLQICQGKFWSTETGGLNCRGHRQNCHRTGLRGGPFFKRLQICQGKFWSTETGGPNCRGHRQNCHRTGLRQVP
ncbi:hypothetical protein Peur_022008 [Populus x canadensis]